MNARRLWSGMAVMDGRDRSYVHSRGQRERKTEEVFMRIEITAVEAIKSTEMIGPH